MAIRACPTDDRAAPRVQPTRHRAAAPASGVRIDPTASAARLDARSIAALQRTAGNHAVQRLVQRPPTAKAGGLTVQRDAVWWRAPAVPSDDVIAIAGQVNGYVMAAREVLVGDPLHPALTAMNDGYATRWLGVFGDFLRLGTETWLYTAFGYAVEAYANYSMRGRTFAGGHTVEIQASRAGTRPDFVVCDPTGTEVAWLDVTSATSSGHIFRKTGSQWNTLPYVAEIVYPPLNKTEFGKSGATLSPADKEALQLGISAKAAREEALRLAQADLTSYLQGQKGAITTYKRGSWGASRAISAVPTRTKARAAIAGHLQVDETTVTQAKINGLLAVCGLASPGYGHTAKPRADLGTARELLLDYAVDHMEADLKRFHGLAMLRAHADLNPPTTGETYGLFGGALGDDVADDDFAGQLTLVDQQRDPGELSAATFLGSFDPLLF